MFRTNKYNKKINNLLIIIYMASQITKKQMFEEKNNNSFMDKKKVIILTFGIILTVVLIALTFKLILVDIDFKELGKSLKKGIVARWWILIVVLLFGFGRVFCTVVTVWVRLERLGYKVRFWKYIIFCLSYCFLQTVTPANFVSDPFILYWIKTQGANNGEAFAITSTNGLIGQSIQVLITLPSFCIIAPHYSAFHNISWEAEFVYWLMIAGVAFDLFTLAFFSVMSFSKKTAYFLSCCLNKVKKFFHLPFHTKEQSREKYLVQGYVANVSKRMFMDHKWNILILFCVVATEIFQYSMMYFCILWLMPENIHPSDLNFGDVFNCANVALTANKMLPLPGGMGSLEMSLKYMLEAENVCKVQLEQDPSIIDNSILNFRVFNSYLPAGIGLFCFGFWTITIYRNSKFKCSFIKKITLEINNKKNKIRLFIKK